MKEKSFYHYEIPFFTKVYDTAFSISCVVSGGFILSNIIFERLTTFDHLIHLTRSFHLTFVGHLPG